MLSKLTKLFGNKPDADSAADTMTLTDAQVLEAVAGLTDSNTGKTYAAAKAVKNIKISADQLSLEVVLAYPAASQFERVAEEFHRLAIRRGRPCIECECEKPDHQPRRPARRAPAARGEKRDCGGIRQGRCGQIHHRRQPCLALQAEGARVGILDADIYGPRSR
jgi:ATP-binding protein involved in chromosome partitioning